MGGSQLTQLKSALSSAGLNRKTASKKDKKAWKKGGARESDRGKTLAKLEDIRKSLNKFDERETRVKHDVGGRNLKGVTGRPSASKQAGLEQRKKTLLPEHQLKGHTGTFRDRRFGESDPNMSLEDRMLERYTRERQKGQGRKGMFNLEDEEDELDGFDEGTALGGLTHGGRSVSDLPGDDFMLQGLGDDDEEEDEDVKEGRIGRRLVSRGHFGGFDEDDEELPEKKKSKAEVMSEIIAKSKEHKLERQKQKEMDDDLRDALDENLDDLRELLASAPRPDKAAAASILPGPSRPAARPVEGAAQDTDYDQMVRTLGYESRAKPKDRTKTEEELAIEEAEKLQKAEAKRLRRMRGEDASDDEDEAEGVFKKRRKLEKRGEADDLDDDFVDDDEELLGPGLTREGLESMALPQRDESEEDEDEDEEDEEDDSEEDDDEDDEEDVSEMEDLNDDEAPELVPVDSDDDEAVVKRSKTSGKGKGKAKATTKEIPFTFPCPTSIEELEDIMDDLDDSALPTVVQRIRAVHHPSLAQGNKEKLQDFLGVLLDYILILASRPTPSFDLISALVPHLVALVKLNPVTASSHFISKITLMQKNLTKGLMRGAYRPESKTFPRCAELVLLRLVGTIWSTSDYSNPVVVPAVLLMGQYLAQSRVRSTADIASGLFLCSILAQFESLSKRLVPEAVNFIASSLLILLPRRKDAKTVAFPDTKAPEVDLKLSPTSQAAPTEPVDLAAALGDETEEVKADLVAAALRLVQTYAAMYASHEAFIEVFKPVLTVVEGSRLPKHSDSLKAIHTTAQSALSRMLGFATTSRTPLAMQAHKPIPIATFAPRFEDDFAPGRHYDPDAERNASNKLKALYKKERKGAIRELRKDNRFLAGEKAREQAEKDQAYNAKMRRVEGEITIERAEEKEMQREKAREKRRAGRK